MKSTHSRYATLFFSFLFTLLFQQPGVHAQVQTQTQVYALGNTGPTAGWYLLGTLQLPQQGYDAVIRIYGGYGYNAAGAQIGDCHIRIRTSNGANSDDGFYAAAYFYNTGFVRLATAVKIEQVDLSTWRIYAQLPNYTGAGARLELEAYGGTWTPGFVVATAPAGRDLTEKMMIPSPVEATVSIKAARLFAGNATARANSRNSINSFNGGNDPSVSTGWIAADMGGTDNADRLVIGAGYGGKPIIGVHNADLTAWGTKPLLINPSGGNVGIGTTNPTEKLSVDGNIRTRKLIVSATGWGDFVFDSTYRLPALADIHNYVKINKHLPDIPPAAVIEKEGADVGEIQKQLVKKMEEMTLYMIEQERRLKEQEARIQVLEQQLKTKP